MSSFLLLFGFGFAQDTDSESFEAGREHHDHDHENISVSGADSLAADSSALIADSVADTPASMGSIPADSVAADTTAARSFLDDVMTGSNKDSLTYDVINGIVTIFEQGDVSYQNMNIKADYMRLDMNTKEIYAYGRMDSTTNEASRPEFIEGNSVYTMDTLNYNITTQKAKIKGVLTEDGDGILQGVSVKKMPDNSININRGRYTTCDADHPHFYIAMPKAKFMPGEKVVVGPSYMVMEDVPLYFLGVPFGFFPLEADRSSGFIMPSYGEETTKGFFIRDGGYYYVVNDYIDLTLTGGYYTYGSWDASMGGRYSKRYRYSGSFDTDFSKYIYGDEGSADYINLNSLKVAWTHQQDSKFKPNSTFSASVNFSTSGYAKYGSTTMTDYLSTQTNSSISYSKKWDDSPFSLSVNVQHSQNSQDSTVSLSAPTATLSMSRIYPFQRKNAVGSEKWYEKISLSYTGNMANKVTVDESDFLTSTMFKDMEAGVKHSIPVSTSFNLTDYITISPSFSYIERWYFEKVAKEWDEETESVIEKDTTAGFYRLYDYSVSASASTTVYGMFTVKNQNAWLKAVRHTMTPSLSVSYRPDFGAAKYGYYETVQSSSSGSTTTYSPYSNGMYGVPSQGESASLSFSLSNTLEMKVASDRDTTGVRKISLIDNLSFSGSYNFIADSMNLSTISMSFRSTLTEKIGLNISATLDPYEVTSDGTRIDQYMFKSGKIGRISSASTSFSYSFNSKATSGKSNSLNNPSDPTIYHNEFEDAEFYTLDPTQQRALLSSSYYDFSIPWNLSLSYSFSYKNSGIAQSIDQTLSFNGSVNLTDKWGVSFNAGYDFEMKTITPGTFSLSRDLHCWQMSFSWVPTGYRQSWSFSISAKSSLLQDLKYDKSNSYYDNLYEY